MFSKLYKKEFGIDLSIEESKELASRLLFLYESIFGKQLEDPEAKNDDRRK